MSHPYLLGKVRPRAQAAASVALLWQLLAASPAAADVALPAEGSAVAALAVAAPPGAEAPRDLSKYKEESVPGGDLMILAYLVMWGLLGGFAVRMALRQGKLEREIASLQDRLDRGA